MSESDGNNTQEEFYTAASLAQEAGIGRAYTAKLCRQGKIPAIKVGGNWLIKFIDGQAWLNERNARLSERSS